MAADSRQTLEQAFDYISAGQVNVDKGFPTSKHVQACLTFCQQDPGAKTDERFKEVHMLQQSLSRERKFFTAIGSWFALGDVTYVNSDLQV